MRITYTLILCTFCLILTDCSFTKKIKSGEDAFQVKQFAIAAQMLTEEYRATNFMNEKARKAFLIGQSYEKMNRTKDAIDWYKASAEHNYGPAAQELYARSLKNNQQYELAIEQYRELARGDQANLIYRQQVAACQLAMEWWEERDQSPYRVENSTFNTPAAEYAPFVIGPDALVMSSDRPNSTGDDKYQWTGNSFSDLFVVNVSTDEVSSFDPSINTKENEGTFALTEDQQEMYFTRCFSDAEYDSFCKLMYCTRRGNNWSDPEVLGFVKEGVNYGHPALAEGDSLLFFSCNDPEGAGGYDIYYCRRTISGWSQPIILDNRINTGGDEKFPTIHRDTMYFSSDFHTGMGGLDIFKTYTLDDGNWAPPMNLKPPVNSGWDDFAFVVDTFATLRGQVVQKGYFSSTREGGKGGDDIYAFEKVNIAPSVPADEIVTNPGGAKEHHLFLVLKILGVFEIPIDPNSARIGNKPLAKSKVIYNIRGLDEFLRPDQNGNILMELEWGKPYDFMARCPGYLSDQLTIITADIEKDPNKINKTITREIVLEPIFANREINLSNIYYEFEKWFITDEAKPTLNNLARILKNNPRIQIEMGSHTDCRGEDEYNLDLSQKRAQSAINYLALLGVDQSRLSAKGYGETSFAIDCQCDQCTEDQHQANRRTTFKILE